MTHDGAFHLTRAQEFTEVGGLIIESSADKRLAQLDRPSPKRTEPSRTTDSTSFREW